MKTLILSNYNKQAERNPSKPHNHCKAKNREESLKNDSFFNTFLSIILKQAPIYKNRTSKMQNARNSASHQTQSEPGTTLQLGQDYFAYTHKKDLMSHFLT